MTTKAPESHELVRYSAGLVSPGEYWAEESKMFDRTEKEIRKLSRIAATVSYRHHKDFDEFTMTRTMQPFAEQAVPSIVGDEWEIFKDEALRVLAEHKDAEMAKWLTGGQQ